MLHVLLFKLSEQLFLMCVIYILYKENSFQ